MKIKQARLTTEELYQAKWYLGGMLTLLALWALWALQLQAEPLLAFGVLFIGFALVRPGWSAGVPKQVWRMAGPVILVLVATDFFLSVPNFLPPLMRMIAMLLIYRALAPRKHREDLQLVLLALFSVVVSGVLTVSLLFALQILIFTPLAIIFLFLVCLLHRGPESLKYQPGWKGFRLRALIGRVRKVLDFRVVGLTVFLFGLVAVLSTVFFILMPRFNFDQTIPFLKLTTQPLSGFSEEVSLGDVTEITQDRTPALQVDVPSYEAVDPSPYWRMLVLDQYEDGGFKLSSELKLRRYRESQKTRELPGWGVPSSARGSGMWTFYLEGRTSRYLPVPGPHRGIRFMEEQSVMTTDTLYLTSLEAVQQKAFFYQIEDLEWARRFPAHSLEVEAFSRISENSKSRDQYPLTTLRVDLSENDRAVLEEMNTAILGTEEAVDALTYSQMTTEYLRQKFSYSLRPDGMGAASDPIVSWLKSGSQGHCELFAGSFILLAREAGFPARMVVGFAGGGWNAVESYFIVRNSDAHAWVEIYHAPTREWVRVDPTPGSASSNPDAPPQRSFESESGWQAWLDSLRVQWYRRVVNFEQDDQMRIASSLMDKLRKLRIEFGEWMRQTVERLSEWIAAPLSGLNWLRIAAVLAAVLALPILWRIRFLLMGLLFRMFQRPDILDPFRRQASGYLRRISARTEIRDAEETDRTVRALKAIRFGPPVDARAANAAFKDARRLLRQRSK